MNPYVENRVKRRLSAYDPKVFYPPMPMRPKTSPFYSWPRKRGATGSPTPPQATHQFLPEDEDEQTQSAQASGEGQSPTSVGTEGEPRETPLGSDVQTHSSAVPSNADGSLAQPTPPVRATERTLCFTVNPNTEDERDIQYRCSKSNANSPLAAPPLSARSPGDVHFHIFMGGVQYWVVGSQHTWIKTKLGEEHPSMAGRLLSHRSPHNTKYPNWVLSATYTTYIARDRRKKGL